MRKPAEDFYHQFNDGKQYEEYAAMVGLPTEFGNIVQPQSIEVAVKCKKRLRNRRRSRDRESPQSSVFYRNNELIEGEQPMTISRSPSVEFLANPGDCG